MLYLPYVWAVLRELGLVEVVRQRVVARYGVTIPPQDPDPGPAAGYRDPLPSEYDPDVHPYWWNVRDRNRPGSGSC